MRNRLILIDNLIATIDSSRFTTKMEKNSRVPWRPQASRTAGYITTHFHSSLKSISFGLYRRGIH